MQFLGDDRGVSEVLGAILVFGLVVALLLLVQTLAVPAANNQVEFDHNQRVQNDLQSFEENVDRTAASGLSESTSVEAGVRYPPRLFLLNPGPASGAVRTEAATLGVDGAVALDDETADYWSGDARDIDTRRVIYSPNYNYYGNAPSTVYESGVLYNQFDDESVVAGGSNLVAGRRIALTALDGDLSTTSSGSTLVETNPLSAPARTISITDAGTDTDGQAVEIRVNTQLSEDTWNRLLESEIDTGVDDDGRYIEEIDCPSAGSTSDPCGTLVVTMEQGYTYDLRMAEVGVGPGASSDGVEYLVDATESRQLTEDEPTDFTVGARDGFNTRQSGVDVTYELQTGSGSFVDDDDGDGSITVTTDESGDAPVTFVPTGDAPVTIEASAEFDGTGGTSERERVLFDALTVGEGTDSGDNDDLNPNEGGKVRLIEVSSVGAGGDASVSATFQYIGTGTVNMVGARVNFHSAGGPGGSGASGPSEVEIAGRSPKLDVAGQFKTFSSPITIEDDASGTTVDFVWDEKIQENHIYAISFEFSNGNVDTYLISHPK